MADCDDGDFYTDSDDDYATYSSASDADEYVAYTSASDVNSIESESDHPFCAYWTRADTDSELELELERQHQTRSTSHLPTSREEEDWIRGFCEFRCNICALVVTSTKVKRRDAKFVYKLVFLKQNFFPF